jgi:hypothetical protein
VLGHDAFGVDREPHLGGLGLLDGPIAVYFGLEIGVIGWRADHEIRVPSGGALADGVVLLVDNFAVLRRFSEGITLVEKIIEEIQAGGGSVSGRTGMISVFL